MRLPSLLTIVLRRVESLILVALVAPSIAPSIAPSSLEVRVPSLAPSTAPSLAPPSFIFRGKASLTLVSVVVHLGVLRPAALHASIIFIVPLPIFSIYPLKNACIP